MLIGYTRVSTDGDRQVLDLQRDALLAAGVDERHLFEDRASGSRDEFFRAGGFGRAAGRLNAHYGDDPGSNFYTHLSDRFAPFYIKVIAATASKALHVLDGLLYHQSEVTVRHHHTDGGGDSDHVFAPLALLGFQFAPRIPDLKHRRPYSFAKPSAYPALEPLIAGRIRTCPTISSLTCRRSAGSTSISPATTSGRPPTRRRKTVTDSGPCGRHPTRYSSRYATKMRVSLLRAVSPKT
jgi:hypothetical protein